MKQLLSILLLSFLTITACAQIQPAPPAGSKAYGTTTYISPDGLLWYGTNPLKYRGVYPKTKVDSLLALIPIFNSALYYSKTESDARFVSLTGSYVNPSWIASLDYGKITNTPIVTTPNLQSVTTGAGNNITSNAVIITGETGYDPSVNGVTIGNTSDGFGYIHNRRNGELPSAIDFDEFELKLSYNGSEGSGRLHINVESPSFPGAWFENRVAGLNAIATNEFTTLGQVNTLISAIPAPDLSNYVDKTTDQTIGGNKTFTENLLVDGITVGGSFDMGNNILGEEALKLNTTGSANIAIGLVSLYSNTTGARNVAIGAQSLNGNIIGGDNTAIGDNSGGSNTGNQNTYVGSNTNQVAPYNFTNSTTIGNSAIVNKSNKVQLGNFSIIELGVGSTVFTGVQGGTTLALPITSGTLALKSEIPNVSGYELLSNKQNSLTIDGTGIKYSTIDAVNTGLTLKQNAITLTTLGTGASTFNQSTGALNIPISGSGSGSVTNVSSSDANITVATGTTTPVLTLASTITSNTTGNSATTDALKVFGSTATVLATNMGASNILLNATESKVVDITGNANTSTDAVRWGGRSADLNGNNVAVTQLLTLGNADNTVRLSTIAQLQGALALGSNAYTSTAYLPLTGGDITDGTIKFKNASNDYVGLFGTSKHISGGSDTDFNTYVYGNNPYNIWTNGVSRFTLAGNGDASFTNQVTAPILNGNLNATTATIANAPVNPTDAIRLTDLNGYAKLAGNQSFTGQNTFTQTAFFQGNIARITGTGRFSLDAFGLDVSNTSTNTSATLGNDGSLILGTNSSGNQAVLKSTNVTGNKNFEYPDASGTLALRSDLNGYAKLVGDNSFSGGGVQNYFSTDLKSITFNPDLSYINIQTNSSDKRYVNLGLEGISFSTYAAADGYATFKTDNITTNTQRILQVPNADGTIALTSQFESGTYTPTTTNFSNVSASTPFVFKYQRIENIVFVYGMVTVTPSAASSGCMLTITLPINTNLDNTYDLIGQGSATLASDITNVNLSKATSNTAQLDFRSGANTSAQSIKFSFSYEIK